MNTGEVTLGEFAVAFGTKVEAFSRGCRGLIESTDLRYTVLEGEELNQAILYVLKRIESDQQKVGTKERQATWEESWKEALSLFCKSSYDLDMLVPKFFRPYQLIRLNQQYVMPADPYFELSYFGVFRRWLFETYLKEVDTVYEFGCGTGVNLAALAQVYPDKELHGLDFVPSSRDFVNKIAEVYGWRVSGHLFDMASPDATFEMQPNSAVLTIWAIEQLGEEFEPFLQYVLTQSPKLCINVEPTFELYDQNDLLDYLAARFHQKRGYPTGYLTRLRELEVRGQVQILKTQRLFMGSLYHEGYSFIVWRPKA